MEDYGKGYEVFVEPQASQLPRNIIMSYATDENILSFVKTLKLSTDAENLIKTWIENINNSENYTPLNSQEKERLKSLLS
jgi:hypothetical protein